MNREEANLEKVLEELKRHPEVVGAYLFGSHAKGNITPLSDVDLAVILKEVHPETEAEIGSMYSDKIDLVLFHKLPLYIKFEVLKHGKELFVKDEDFLFELKLALLREYLETAWLYERIKAEVFE